MAASNLMLFVALIPALLSVYLLVFVDPVVLDLHVNMLSTSIKSYFGVRVVERREPVVEKKYEDVASQISRLKKKKERKEPKAVPVREIDATMSGEFDLCEEELREYDGRDVEGKLLVSVGGYIFDISDGRKFYGKGGPYNVFAGRVATKALSIGSMDEEDLTDDLTGVDEKAVEQQIKFYGEKYEKVGTLKKTC